MPETEDYIMVQDENGNQTKVYALSDLEKEEILKGINHFDNTSNSDSITENSNMIQPFLNYKSDVYFPSSTVTTITYDNNWLNAKVKLYYCHQGSSAPSQIRTYIESKNETYGPVTLSQGESATYSIPHNDGYYYIYGKSVDKAGYGYFQAWD